MPQLLLTNLLNTSRKKHLTSTVVYPLLEAGLYPAQVARKLGVSRSAVSQFLKRRVESGELEVIESYPRFYKLRDVKQPSGGYGVEAEKIRGSGVPAFSRGGVTWEAHHVKGSVVLKSVDWEKVVKYAHRVNRIKPNQFIFYFQGATVTFRKHSLWFEVFGCRGQDSASVLRQARERVAPVLASLARDLDARFGLVEVRGDLVHWVLSEGLSRELLKWKPELADGSHPKSVEVKEREKLELDYLLSGGLRRDLVELKELFSFGEVKPRDWRDAL